MIDEKIRLLLELVGTEQAATLAKRLAELGAAGVASAEKLTKGEISAKEFAEGQRTAAAEVRALETAVKTLAAAAAAAAEEQGRATAAAAAAAEAQGRSAAAAEEEAAALQKLAQSERDAAEAAQMFLDSQRQTAARATAHPIPTQHADVSAVDFNAEVEAQHKRQTAAAAQAARAEVELARAEAEHAAVSRQVAAALSEFAFEEQVAATQANQLAVAEHNVTDATQTLTLAAGAAAVGAGSLGTKIVATKNGMGGLNQTIMAGSFAFQDFTATSGDLGAKLNSISNNLPILFSAAGIWGQVAAVAATAGIAIYRNWDSIAGLWETRNPFPKAAQDVRGLKDELEKANTEYEKLSKLGSINADQATRVGELRALRTSLEQEIKDREEIERLTKSKSAQQEAVSKAFATAVQESGGGKALENLKDLMGDRHHTRAKGFESADQIVAAILKGDNDAYQLLIESLSKGLGRESNLLSRLKSLKPDLDALNPVKQAEKEWADEMYEMGLDAAEYSKQIALEGAEHQAEMLHDIADETRKGLESGIGKRLQDVLIRTRASGSKGAKEVTYLTSAIADEIRRMYPSLEAFPVLAANVAKEMARKIKVSVDNAIEEMMQVEGLTKAEALRRLNQQRAAKAQDKTEALASDEFKQAAASQAKRFARLNPGAAPATPKDLAARAEQMQSQLKDLGVTPKQQVQIGKILNDPRAARIVPGAMEALGNRGFGEAEAMRALPELFRQLRGGQAGIQHAADRMAQAAERAERAAVQRATVQATAVPRVRKKTITGKLPSTVIGSINPAATKAAQDAAKARIADETAKAAVRNAPKAGPQASLIPAVSAGQDAMAAMQTATAANTRAIAAINARAPGQRAFARQIQTAAFEQSTTALNFGSRV